ncbi:hypothetical protein [Natrinema halophilum]|uniref:Uncharacterized protein n=1 Tax=Natrinema halophilum TaxID=1699371 RepID=A0A7D5KY83_9EURY|nr:hypothetical protein [Natrinema halophilum]QLG50222.1 hypothetical protein HYG82_15865 [Natrinema halophilum]
MTSSVTAASDSFNKFAELSRNGNFEEAEKVAKENDFEYHLNTVRAGHNENGLKSTSGSVSAQHYYKKPSSTGSGEVSLITGKDGREMWVTLYWDLYYNTSPYDFDGQMPKDACVIAWEDSQWGLVGLDTVISWSEVYAAADKIESKKLPVEMQGGGLIGEQNNALGFTVIDWLKDRSGDILLTDRCEGAVQAKLRKQNYPERQPGRIETLYEHTWSIGSLAGWNFLENVSISPTGTVSVSVPIGADSWEEQDDYSA